MSDKNLAPVCGIYCGTCEYFEKQCQGCGNVKGKPFWTKFMKVDICPMYDCCLKKKVKHCGLCDGFPCNIFMGMEANDPNMSSEQAEKSAEKRKNELIKRKEIGTEKWLEERETC